MKKLILVIALLMMAAVLLAACDSTADVGDTTDTTPADTTPADITTPVDTTTPAEQAAETTPAVKEVRVLATKDGCEYPVLRSEFGDDMLTQASINLKNALVAKLGDNAVPVLNTDWIKGVRRGQYTSVEGKEILIGNTNRTESRDALAELGENEYVVRWSGEKLVIIGSSDYATNAAVDAFIEQCINSAEGDKLALPLDLNIKGKASIQKIELAEGADIRVMTFNILGSTIDTNNRKLDIIQTIVDYLPDVVGFQESNSKCLKNIHQSATISQYYGVNRGSHGNGSTTNYTPILYLKSKYKQVEGGVEWNRCRYEGTNTKSMSWTVLERLSDGKQFIVVNIHGSLWSTSYTLPAGETHESMNAKAAKAWKEDNVTQMLEKIAELQGKYGNIPVFTMGDYNFNKTHSAYALMKSTGLENSQEKAISATPGASFHSNPGQSPDEAGLPIDHIFFSPDSIDPIKHVICKRTIDIAASDHCPVYTDFKLKK